MTFKYSSALRCGRVGPLLLPGYNVDGVSVSWLNVLPLFISNLTRVPEDILKAILEPSSQTLQLH